MESNKRTMLYYSWYDWFFMSSIGAFVSGLLIWCLFKEFLPVAACAIACYATTYIGARGRVGKITT